MHTDEELESLQLSLQAAGWVFVGYTPARKDVPGVYRAERPGTRPVTQSSTTANGLLDAVEAYERYEAASKERRLRHPQRGELMADDPVDPVLVAALRDVVEGRGWTLVEERGWTLVDEGGNGIYCAELQGHNVAVFCSTPGGLMRGINDYEERHRSGGPSAHR